MVALSLYRGNLHKVPDVPRRWPRPTPKISLKDFRILLRRRSRALTRQLSSTAVVANATASNPNPVSVSNHDDSNLNHDKTNNSLNNNHDANQNFNIISFAETQLPPPEELKGQEIKGSEVKVKGDTVIESEDLKNFMEKTGAVLEEKNGDMTEQDKVEVLINGDIERCNTDDVTHEKEKRKKEIMEKLEILNAKKHSLVQVLKQILSAEEQLKSQNNMQGAPGRPPLPLQVDTTTDTGSVTRVNTPRIGADGNSCGDLDGGETDDVSNNNIRSRHLQRMSSTSPSSDYQLRKPVSNMQVPLTHRASLGLTGSPSPSRFAPLGQVQSSVSVSGISYIASSPSPSPAASGGTSVFRDGRLSSPWN